MCLQARVFLQPTRANIHQYQFNNSVICIEKFLKNLHCFTDINECESDSEEPPVCSHECHNFPGGYNCSCYHGYTLKDDGKCLVKGNKLKENCS